MRRERRLRRTEALRRLRRWGFFLVGALAFAATVFLMLPQQLGGRDTYVIVSGHSMEPTMHNGDLAVIRTESEYHVGDVIAYRVPGHAFDSGAVVIHRIVGGTARTGFTTRGDNNGYNDPWHPRPQDAWGARVARVPSVGVVFSHLRGPAPLAAFAALMAVVAGFEVVRPQGRTGRRGRRLAPTS
jgi:signal peptidase